MHAIRHPAAMLRYSPMDRAPEFMVGTASWTDPTLVRSDSFYPRAMKTAEDRLRFYSAHFNTVEVDSTYYALPAERNAVLWAERTPAGFIFNIKAYAMLTGHPAEVSRMPVAMRETLSAADRAAKSIRKPPLATLDLAFRMFWSAIGPLRDAGKLGMVLFQFPPWFTQRTSNLDYIASLPSRIPGAPLAIEFRHNSWLAEGPARDATIRFLDQHSLALVSVDTPPGTIASFLAATTDIAYVRFHGRNRENWSRRGGGAAERFKYLYSEAELAPWAERIRNLAGVRRAYVLFNNCYSNFGIMNATTMAQMLRRQERDPR